MVPGSVGIRATGPTAGASGSWGASGCSGAIGQGRAAPASPRWSPGLAVRLLVTEPPRQSLPASRSRFVLLVVVLLVPLYAGHVARWLLHDARHGRAMAGRPVHAIGAHEIPQAVPIAPTPGFTGDDAANFWALRPHTDRRLAILSHGPAGKPCRPFLLHNRAAGP